MIESGHENSIDDEPIHQADARHARLVPRRKADFMSELILVIEDEKEIQDLIRYNLEKSGYRVAVAKDGDSGLERLFASRPDAVILDLMLPGATGLEILKDVRGDSSMQDLPVLVLTARSTEMDKLVGFEHGADDYLTKPFSAPELVARVRALMRRVPPRRRLLMGDVAVDLAAARVSRGGDEVDLTRREFELVAFLAAHPGRVFTRGELLDRVWGEDFVGTERTVDQHVAQVRGRLGEGLIETVRGRGYRLVDSGARD